MLSTDWLLALFVVSLTWTLYRQTRWRSSRAVRLWRRAFCAAAGSAVLAGTWHGFSAQLAQEQAAALWTTALVLACSASLLFLLATFYAYTSSRLRAALAVAAIAKFFAFAVWLSMNDDFRIVVYDSALTMLIIGLFSTWGAWARHLPAAPWVLAGVLVSMIGTLFHQGRVAISPSFDQNDLYHIVQLGSMYFLFRAGSLLRDDEPAGARFRAAPSPPLPGEE